MSVHKTIGWVATLSVPFGIFLLSLINHYVFKIPNIPAVLLLAVVAGAFWGGLRGGFISSALHVLYAVWFFDDTNTTVLGEYFRLSFGSAWDLSYTRASFQRIVVFAIVSPLVALGVGLLKNRLAMKEAALQSTSEELTKFKQTLDATQDSVFMFHPDTLQFFYVNRGACNQLGYTEAELLTLHLYDIKPEYPEPKFREMIALLLDGRQPSARFETVYRHKDGHDFPVEVFLQLVTPAGEPARFVAIVVDITARKAAEAALRENEAKYRLLADNTGDYVQLFALDGTVLYDSPSFERLYGDTYIEKRVLADQTSLVHPEDRELIRAAFSNLVREGGESSVEYRFKLPSGEIRWLEARGRKLAGSEGQILIAARDITERKNAEEQRIADQKRLMTLVDYAPIAIYQLTLATSERVSAALDYISSSISRLSGYSKEEILQPHVWANSLHPMDREETLNKFKNLDEGKIILAEYRFRRKDGRYRWFYDVLTVGHRSPVGKGLIASGFVIDVTDRKEAQQQVIQASKLASLGEMATGLAHEMNQPLNVIKMSASNMMAGLEQEAFNQGKVASQLKSIVAQVDRAARLIDHLRLFGRYSSENFSLVPISDAIEGARSLTQSAVLQKSIDVTFEGATEQIFVTGHPTLLEQVFLNLILNARDAIENRQRKVAGLKGRIGISIRRGPIGWVTLTFDDNGGGIPEHVIEHLFEPFFTTKEPGKGTGLGLSVSYGVVRDMGGTISAETVGEGARFTIVLPEASAEPLLPASKRPPKDPPLHAEPRT